MLQRAASLEGRDVSLLGGMAGRLYEAYFVWPRKSLEETGVNFMYGIRTMSAIPALDDDGCVSCH